jgi:hypothetical protein
MAGVSAVASRPSAPDDVGQVHLLGGADTCSCPTSRGCPTVPARFELARPSHHGGRR